jgi:hypothetical protein
MQIGIQALARPTNNTLLLSLRLYQPTNTPTSKVRKPLHVLLTLLVFHSPLPWLSVMLHGASPGPPSLPGLPRGERVGDSPALLQHLQPLSSAKRASFQCARHVVQYSVFLRRLHDKLAHQLPGFIDDLLHAARPPNVSATVPPRVPCAVLSLLPHRVVDHPQAARASPATAPSRPLNQACSWSGTVH